METVNRAEFLRVVNKIQNEINVVITLYNQICSKYETKVVKLSEEEFKRVQVKLLAEIKKLEKNRDSYISRCGIQQSITINPMDEKDKMLFLYTCAFIYYPELYISDYSGPELDELLKVGGSDEEKLDIMIDFIKRYHSQKYIEMLCSTSVVLKSKLRQNLTPQEQAAFAVNGETEKDLLITNLGENGVSEFFVTMATAIAKDFMQPGFPLSVK